MVSLKLRMWLLTTILFGIVFMLVTLLMRAMNITNLYFYVFFACGITLFQYLIGPKIVEMSMRVTYLKREEAPWLFEMVENLSRTANIPMPRIGVANISVPNAFAFGRSVRDGRICVTKGVLDLLNRDELRAVLGHEMTHLKSRDVLFITFLSVIPLILYQLFYNLTFFGSFSRRRESSGNAALIGLVAFVFYFITNLLVLYASRIREYYADKGSVKLGNAPNALASALYKLVYGAARAPKEELRAVEGVKAFFLNDVSRGRQEIGDLANLDLDRSGSIDPFELKTLQQKGIKLSTSDKLMELLSTHPNMLKRIKQLSQYSRA
ncbi:MAG: zinc metalloprotease HtpX [Candidatus Omnitrophica bacterium]|nr:zinc metalloprotease HtpX [Candidatus Omnitrophota bacterium]